jgi:hypothetical protein
LTFRILSLDGGGAGSLLQAMALADLYPDRAGRAILGRFDLAVASGSGALVLGGLMSDLTPAGIVDMFRRPASVEIAPVLPPRRPPGFFSRFGLRSRVETPVRSAPVAPPAIAAPPGLGPRGETPLGRWRVDGPGGSPVGALIVAHDHDRLGARFLRGYDVEATGEAADTLTIAEAVRAAGRTTEGSGSAGDGVPAGYRNPAMAGLIDAMAMGAMPEDIQILSIGSGQVRLPPPHLVAPGGATPRGLVRTASTSSRSGAIEGATTPDDPGDGACWAAHVLLLNEPGEMGRVVRMNPLAQPTREADGAWDYPKGLPATLFDAVARIDRLDPAPGEVDLIVQFGEAWIQAGAPNQPLRTGDDLAWVLGDKTYAAAKRRWRSLLAAER